ncbi:MAG: Dabb family protein [Firmicutes bacterium]|nr:Dabb family protein [Bacillota bacterium]
MLRHIVMWQFKDQAQGASKEENMSRAAEMLQALQGIIPQILSMHIGRDVTGKAGSYDMALEIDFAGPEELAYYTDHPEHKKVSAFIGSVRDSRVSCDFYLD